jgi:hypothetical protein
MAKNSYMIIGLKAPTLQKSVRGTSFFEDNIGSKWYRLREVKTVGKYCTFVFEDGDELPLNYRFGEYEIAVLPHPDFSAIVKEVDDGIVTYTIISTASTDGWANNLVFHYDILKKNMSDEDTEIHMGTTVQSLLDQGFTHEASRDARSVFCGIYNIAKAS